MHVLAVAARYLTKRWINLLPAAAVAVGVSMLLCMIFLERGFRREYVKALAAMEPDLLVYFKRYDAGGARELDAFLSEIESAPEIVAASPILYVGAHLAWRTGRLPDGTWLTDSDWLAVTAIDFELEGRVMDMKRALGSDEDPFTGNASTSQGPLPIVVGAEVFDAVCEASGPGSNRPSRDTSILQLRIINYAGGRAQTMAARATGVLMRTGWPRIDRHFVFMPIGRARELFGYGPDEIEGIHVRLDRRDAASLLAAEKHIRGVIEARRKTAQCKFIHYWAESMWPVMTFERAVYITLLLLIVSAGFTLSAVMILSVLQKKPDIGILRSMGCSKKGIAGIFLLYGALTGAAGAAAGGVVALVILLNIDTLNLHLLKPLGLPRMSKYPFVTAQGIPWSWSWKVFAVTAVISVCIGLAAGIVPALKAARLDPVRSIRGE